MPYTDDHDCYARIYATNGIANALPVLKRVKGVKEGIGCVGDEGVDLQVVFVTRVYCLIIPV